MRAFASGYYGNLKSMYDHLGQIAYQSQAFLFDFALLEPSAEKATFKARSYFVHPSNLHAVPPVRDANIIMYFSRIVYLLICYAWFTLCCFFIMPRPCSRQNDCESFREYLARIRLPTRFMRYYLLPLLSSVTTCTHDALLDFPAVDLTMYKRRTHRQRHFTVSGGIQQVQQRLSNSLNIRLLSRVVEVHPHPTGVEIHWSNAQSSPEHRRKDLFDEVVLAVSPDIVGQIFVPLKRAMAGIPTVLVQSTCHTAEPDHPSTAQNATVDIATAAQVIHLRTTAVDPHRTESIHVQPSGIRVTTCAIAPIQVDRIIQASTFTRVLRTPESRRVVNDIFWDDDRLHNNPRESAKPVTGGWRNGDNHVWLVGGWCWDGMVLLEGCVVSAVRVAKALDVPVPW